MGCGRVRGYWIFPFNPSGAAVFSSPTVCPNFSHLKKEATPRRLQLPQEHGDVLGKAEKEAAP